MPMTVVGCNQTNQTSIQHANVSQTQAGNISNAGNSADSTTSANAASPTNSTSSQTTVNSQAPNPTTVFQNIDKASATGASGSNIQKVLSSGKQGLQQAIQQTPVKPTEAQVAAPFVSQLEELQSTYIEKLYALYNSAKAEYHSGQESKLQIVSKYTPQAISLENQAQDQVNSVLFTLRNKLVAQGYSTQEVNVLRNAYYSEVGKMQAQFGE